MDEFSQATSLNWHRCYVFAISLFDALGVGPLGDDVVGDPLHQVLRHLVQRHKLPASINDGMHGKLTRA